MEHSREDVITAVRTHFPGADIQTILALVDEYGVQPYERERNRVQIAILNLGAGDEGKLRYFLGVAKRDYRDVLFWSDCPAEAKIDTPEKKERIREMIRKLGLKPPDSLDDA